MRAVVLVGGLGTRLRPLTYTRPKQMLPMLGVTMLEAVLEHLARHGVVEAVLALGYQPDAFVQAFPDGRAAGVGLRYAVESEPLDTAGAIRFAADQAGWLDGDEPFFALNGDVLSGIDLSCLLQFHRCHDGLATIALTRVDDPSRFGVVPTDEAGRVLGFVEKPPRDQAPTDWINAGMYVLAPEALRHLPPGKVSIERVVFPALAASGRLYALHSEAPWVDAGTPEAYLQAHLDRLRAHENGVWCGDGVEIHPTAVVRDAALGAGTVIGPASVVEEAVLLPGCRVGGGVLVHRSLLGAGVEVGPGARVEALTVLGDGERVDAGERLVGVKRPAP